MRTIVKGIAVSIVLTTLYSVTGLSGQRAVSLAAPITVRADADGYVEYLGMVKNSGEKPVCGVVVYVASIDTARHTILSYNRAHVSGASLTTNTLDTAPPPLIKPSRALL